MKSPSTRRKIAVVGGVKKNSELAMRVGSGAARSVVPLGYASEIKNQSTGAPLQSLVGQTLEQRRPKVLHYVTI